MDRANGQYKSLRNLLQKHPRSHGKHHARYCHHCASWTSKSVLQSHWRCSSGLKRWQPEEEAALRPPKLWTPGKDGDCAPGREEKCGGGYTDAHGVREGRVLVGAVLGGGGLVGEHGEGLEAAHPHYSHNTRHHPPTSIHKSRQSPARFVCTIHAHALKKKNRACGACPSQRMSALHSRRPATNSNFIIQFHHSPLSFHPSHTSPDHFACFAVVCLLDRSLSDFKKLFFEP